MCGNGCPQPTKANSVVSCGHMYLDQGEQLATGSNRDNYLSFFAETSTVSRASISPAQVAGCLACRHLLLSAWVLQFSLSLSLTEGIV